MGMEYAVRFPGGTPPPLSGVLTVLAEHGFPVQVRMVNGELSMPGEVPPEGWKEVRLGSPLGMVTLVHRGQELGVVTWGNANEAMQRAWNAVAWAVAMAGQGQILRAEGPQSADDFRASVAVPGTLT